MNLPNKLTVLRVLLIPFFVAALLWDHGENMTLRYGAAAIFWTERSPESTTW